MKGCLFQTMKFEHTCAPRFTQGNTTGDNDVFPGARETSFEQGVV